MDVIIVPVCIASLWSLFLNTEQFLTAAILLFIQAIRFLTSMFALHKHIYGSLQFRAWLAFVYIAALFFIALAMLEAWHWVASSLAQGSYVHLLWNIADSLWSLILMAVVSSLLGAFIGMILLNKKVRKQNLHGSQSSAHSQKIITQQPYSKQPKRTNRS